MTQSAIWTAKVSLDRYRDELAQIGIEGERVATLETLARRYTAYRAAYENEPRPAQAQKQLEQLDAALEAALEALDGLRADHEATLDEVAYRTDAGGPTDWRKQIEAIRDHLLLIEPPKDTRGAPGKSHRNMLAREVVSLMAEWGVPIRDSETGAAATVIRILLQAAGEGTINQVRPLIRNALNP